MIDAGDDPGGTVRKEAEQEPGNRLCNIEVFNLSMTQGAAVRSAGCPDAACITQTNAADTPCVATTGRKS